MSTPRSRTVAVVTVAYNSSGTLRGLLSSLATSEPVPVPVWIVDNDSPDATASAAIAAEFDAHFSALDLNRGYGGAINLVVATLPPKFDSVLIVNPDVIVAEGAISQLLASIADGIAVVGPRILNADGSIYPSARNQPSLRTGLGHALFSGVWPENPWSRTYRQELSPEPASERDVGWLSGACLLVDRAKFDEVGGFDEDFFMYFEDVDLGRRFLDRGYTNRYVPTATITHLGAHSTSSNPMRMIAAHHDSAYLFLAKRYTGTLHAPLRLGLRIALGVRARWQSLRRRP